MSTRRGGCSSAWTREDKKALGSIALGKRVVSGRKELTMPPTPRARRLAVEFCAVVLAGSVVVLGCATNRPIPESVLSEAGFRPVPANSPKKLSHLRTLPAHRLIERTKAGQPYYVYADPDSCKCLYVGDAAAWAKYRVLTKQISLPPREVIDWELAGVPGSK
jgi:hypothetical protein